jgi:hypothetical protein
MAPIALITSKSSLEPWALVSFEFCEHIIYIPIIFTHSLSKINESSMFLWLGVVLQTFYVAQHACLRIPLTLCIGSTGTYDLGTQISVSARKTNSNDVYVPQSAVPHSLLSITNSIL